MARTRQEVRDFLNGLQGQMVNEKCGEYNGQCVSLIKALLEFLGAPNPYAGRGNARDCGDTLVRQGIAGNSAGWLNVCVNRDMGLIAGVRYGHIWLDLSGEMNFEQNGSRALRTTKNTRPISQAQQIVNLDQYINEGGSMANPVKGDVDNILGELWGRAPNPEDYGYTNQNWHDFIYGAMAAYPWRNRFEILQNLYPAAIRDRDNAAGIAEIRSGNLQRVCDGVGVTRQPDEQLTSQAIIDKYLGAVEAKNLAESAQKVAQGQVTTLEARIKELESGDNIIITRTGFTGLFDIIKQYFKKK